MTFEQIKELIDIVCRKGLQSIEIERSDFRVKILGQVAAIANGGETSDASNLGSAVGSMQSGAVESDAGAETAQIEDGAHVIASPIVGTFYAAPSPDSDAYVQVGDTVTVGQVLCIVEAMKLMNEIESDIDGEVIEVFAPNAQPVEYGERLFAIRPA